MARDGYLILDSDLHMMEPDDLWARYLDGPHRANLPRFFGGQQQKLAEAPTTKATPTPSWGWRWQDWRFPRTARRLAPRCRAESCGAGAARGIHTSKSRVAAASI